MEQKVITQFLYNYRLKFNEIEKSLKIRSNKLSYHLKKLKEKGILDKKREFYRLSENAETLIPYSTSKQSVLPVILITIKKIKKYFYIKEKKDPTKIF